MPNLASSTAVPESGVWRERLRICSFDVDFTRQARPEAICRYFLEAAWNHAEQLGFGYNDLGRQNLLWVLSRLYIQFDTYPNWGDTVELTTWPAGVSGAFALRDFEIWTLQGTRLVAGSSSWLILQASNHRPQRIDKLALNIPAQPNRQSVGRIARKLPSSAIDQPGISQRVCYSDIDVNHHVNSARYIDWLLDCYPEPFHRERHLRSLEINYVGETRWDETVRVCTSEQSSTQYAHAIVKTDGGEVCRAELTWSPESSSVPTPSQTFITDRGTSQLDL